MLDRLKSLPLTIFLTILVWMYAEAQFATTQDNVRVSIKVLSPSPDLTVSALDPIEGRYRNNLNVVISVQGAKSQVDRLYQMSLNAQQPDEELQNLSFTPDGSVLKDAKPSVDMVTLLNGLRYFREHGITVTLANPARVPLRVEKLDHSNDIHPAPSTEH